MASRKGNRRTGQAMSRWVWILTLGAGIVLASTAHSLQEESAFGTPPLLNRLAPAWSVQSWINSPPLDVDQLRGQVVLLRFFNDNPSGASSLKEWFRVYHSQGFVVVGLYAPAPMPAETEPDYVRRLAASLDFQFPVGVDSRWETLNRYWLDRADAAMTAATFLLDRQGKIRHIQPDGQYDKQSRNRTARREHDKLQAAIETLLKETAETPE